MKPFFASVILATLLAACQQQVETTPQPPQEIESAGADEDSAALEIIWDEWGVPHIRAATAEDAFYGFGWAQMRGRPNLVLKLMGQGRGRAAEYWGEEYFDGDALMWTLGVPQQIDEIYAAQGPEFAARFDAFAAAINDYATANPDEIDESMKRVLPVTARDVLGHGIRSIHLTFVAGRQLQALQSMSVAADQSDRDEETPGSNAWAIAPSRSASGNAMLLANPHLPWDDLYYFFEAHIQTPELNAYGVSLIANPFLAIAFNENMGWTHTVNTYDGADVYEFDRQEDDSYVDYDGEKEFDIEEHEILVRLESGEVERRRHIVRQTSAGPVVRLTDQKAYAIRIAGLEPEHQRIGEQYWEMAKAKDLASFETAMSKKQMPMFNTLYADGGGNIFYLFNGLLPVRSSGDHQFWAGIVPGDDEAYRWDVYHPYNSLPKTTNPSSGFLQNANEPPWTSAIPPLLDPNDYPADLVPPLMRSRPQHSIELLRNDASISFDEMVQYTHSPNLVAAENILDELIDLAQSQDDSEMAKAATVLKNWDRSAKVDSRGAVLFQFWMNEYNRAGERFETYENDWSIERPTEPPSGLKNPDAALAALRNAATTVEEKFGDVDVAWGDFARVKRDGVNLPVAVAPGGLGAFRVGWIGPSGDDDGYELTGGTTYVATVEFDDRPNARAILPYGNFESRPAEINSQWELFAAGNLRSVNFTESDIQSSMKMREVFEQTID